MSLPNVLLIQCDQLAAGALSSYGNQTVLAPQLDQLASQGVVMERAYCPSPLCVPSRAAMMTGLLPSRNGAYDNAGEFPAGVPTLAHYLRRNGYHTQLIGKMHFIGPDQLHGFEERPVSDVYPAGLDWIPDWDLAPDARLPWYHDMSSVVRAGPVRAALQIDYDEEVAFRTRRALRDAARARERPFFITASFTFPHDPYEMPPRYWDRYENVPIDAPRLPAVPFEAQDPHSQRISRMIQADKIVPTAEQVLSARRGYYAAISFIDDIVGDLISDLTSLGLVDDTVVVFTSDHGEMLGEGGLWYKMSPREGSARVPLLFWYPGGFRPARIPSPVSLLDLLPTLVELGGGFPPGGAALPLDGTSLLPWLKGEQSEHGDVAMEYLAEGVHAPLVMLVRDQFKLIRCPGDPDLLYDLSSDPDELIDRAHDPSYDAVYRQLSTAVDDRWDLKELNARVRASQKARRVVAEALRTGVIHRWDHPTPDDADRRYLRSGDDFWTRLEQRRLP
ncbi:MAG TPA: choline-sulfatase [Acidimicrobiia bacterium]|nr:choline-sulfatase [Acidimicrobiia bacterium]